MKKLSSFIPILAIVFAIFTGNVALSASYSQELQEAYDFAYKNKITTQNSIDKADMYGGLTRIAMAKMLSQYAINILGKTPDTSKIPNFGDVNSKLDGDYNNGVTLAYQLGIMGVGIDKFRPYDSVTRAEFGTALSRVLYGDKYEGGSQYYTNHLNALKTAGIMNQIDQPNQGEIRGYVMLMLMRANYTQNRNTGLEQINESYEKYEIDNFSEEIEIQRIKKDYNKLQPNTTKGIVRGDNIVFYKNYPAHNIILIFKLIGNIKKEQIDFIEFGFEDCKFHDCDIVMKNYDRDKISDGEISVVLRDDINDIGRNIKYNNVESLGTTVGLELVKVSYSGNISNIKKNGYSENLYEVPIYSSREINIYSNGSDDIDFVKGMSYFKSIMKDKYQSIGEFTIEHGEGKENVYLKEILFNYSGNIDLSQAIDDIKLCNGHTRGNGTACISIPITYTIKDKNIINIKLTDKISASDFSIFAKFKDLMYVGNNRIMLSINGPENFKIEMEDGSEPFYNKISFNGLYTRTKGRNKYEYEKEFGKLTELTNDSDNHMSEPNSSVSDNSSNNSSGDDGSSSDSSNNSKNCVDIEVDDGNSFCFEITKGSGSKFIMSIAGTTNGVYGCSIKRGSSAGASVFNNCGTSGGEFTMLPSNGVSELLLKISYDGKEYTKRASYDLTNGVFVEN